MSIVEWQRPMNHIATNPIQCLWLHEYKWIATIPYSAIGYLYICQGTLFYGNMYIIRTITCVLDYSYIFIEDWTILRLFAEVTVLWILIPLGAFLALFVRMISFLSFQCFHSCFPRDIPIIHISLFLVEFSSFVNHFWELVPQLGKSNMLRTIISICPHMFSMHCHKWSICFLCNDKPASHLASWSVWAQVNHFTGTVQEIVCSQESNLD